MHIQAKVAWNLTAATHTLALPNISYYLGFKPSIFRRQNLILYLLQPSRTLTEALTLRLVTIVQ